MEIETGVRRDSIGLEDPKGAKLSRFVILRSPQRSICICIGAAHSTHSIPDLMNHSTMGANTVCVQNRRFPVRRRASS